MRTLPSSQLGRALAVVSAAALLAGCADRAPLAPQQQAAASASVAETPADQSRALATLRRVTARYHDLNVARSDGFVLLHECENRPGEGPVGTVYYNPARLLDGRVDAALPDALIYEPGGDGRPTLVGVEFAVPDAGQEPPSFFGATFQREEEFGVLALHAWVWRHNPDGMFAETNPRVSCGAE